MYKKETADKKYHTNPYRAVNYIRDENGNPICPNGRKFLFKRKQHVRYASLLLIVQFYIEIFSSFIYFTALFHSTQTHPSMYQLRQKCTQHLSYPYIDHPQANIRSSHLLLNLQALQHPPKKDLHLNLPCLLHPEAAPLT